MLQLAGPGERLRPVRIEADRRRAEMVQHDPEPWKRHRQVLELGQMFRPRGHQVERDVRGLQQAQAFGDVGTLQPVRIRPIVDQAANADEPVPGLQLGQPSRSALGLIQPKITDHPEHLGLSRGHGEHRVGVSIGIGGLDEHRAVDPVPTEEGGELGEVEAASESFVGPGQPVVPAVGGVPGVLVGIDHHRSNVRGSETARAKVAIPNATGPDKLSHHSSCHAGDQEDRHQRLR